MPPSTISVLSQYAALVAVEGKERLLKEVSHMLTFNHPNVMTLIGLCLDGELPLIIMPFMSKGNVLGYITESNDKNKVSEPLLQVILF